MTTIREELADSEGFTDAFSLAALEALGIDPDLPAEWATVDRCLIWLREHGEYPVVAWPREGNTFRVRLMDRGDTHPSWLNPEGAPTLHAALIAACRAVQEAS